MFSWEESWNDEGVLMVVGDLIEVADTQTTGIQNGTIGIITKIEPISGDIIIYWVNLGVYGKETPFWDNEIRLVDDRVS